mmetsp:Transcript_36971/g.106704  ORF Transcript_36971/g.106704 Transcript_36971/m.106704 type:complete len:184 (+) Transcript_36971:185-736(+)
MGAATSGACCGKRAGAITFCRNDTLAAYLEELSKEEKVFHSAYIYREEYSLSAGPPSRSREQSTRHQYVLMYQRSELEVTCVSKDGSSSPESIGRRPSMQRVRSFLRLDWGREGLTWILVDKRLPDALLVRSKVFSPPLKPSALAFEFGEIQLHCFDPDTWNSSHFCFHMLENVGDGQELDYK